RRHPMRLRRCACRRANCSPTLERLVGSFEPLPQPAEVVVMSSPARRALLFAVSATFLAAGLTASAEAVVRPAAPTGLSASATQTTAVLSWSKAKNATKYRACLLETKGQSPCFKLGAKTAKTTTKFTGL